MTETVATRAAADVARRKHPARVRAYSGFRGTMIVLVVLMFLVPLAWMVLASFKTNVDLHDTSKAFIFTPIIDNYQHVLGNDNYVNFVWNSFIVAFLSTGISLIIGVPAAYSMSRFNMQKSALLVLLARIIPGVSLLVPWYYVFANLGWVGGYGVLVISHMFILIPISVYIMMSFFDSMPLELEEASLVDGLTPIGAFLRILLPLSVPGIATAGILSFIFSWNNFMFALVLSGAHTKTLPVAVFDFVSYASIDWGAIMAAAVIMTLPIIVIALFAQKYIVSGLTAGATKG
ncbi:carbohydrate ABC transporter membrane protein 2, CUT1 family [Paramicrobacterium humi]|uniref:Carbohydrate ABC transporter membrane protein 2, CUT1 family n=1 Tax=Paramicrobacterium humi TaxID=640635 RepID=A0A1H4JJ82_9MICO|nr:carbohydrate ABC transporter permease [Microbacterium humi]SEB45936.1 carbohydrate ABC transporter membrane protein 2, CUT1 family [Microbacterium humi]